MESFNHKKEQSYVICRNQDETGDNHLRRKGPKDQSHYLTSSNAALLPKFPELLSNSAMVRRPRMQTLTLKGALHIQTITRVKQEAKAWVSLECVEGCLVFRGSLGYRIYTYYNACTLRMVMYRITGFQNIPCPTIRL